MTIFAKSGKIEEGKKAVALITSLLSGKKTLGEFPQNATVLLKYNFPNFRVYLMKQSNDISAFK